MELLEVFVIGSQLDEKEFGSKRISYIFFIYVVVYLEVEFCSLN